jgi:hypothetical protein
MPDDNVFVAASVISLKGPFAWLLSLFGFPPKNYLLFFSTIS